MSTPAIELRHLSFGYPESRPILRDLSVEIPSGSRTLLVGANGVGKSTLLRLISGHHLVSAEALKVFGNSPFFGLAHGQDVALVDGDFPIGVDLRVHEILDHRGAMHPPDPQRQAELIELLGIDPQWRMNRVSEGQRRRVQLLMTLRRKLRLLLLDEVSSHLDVVVRSDLNAWLKRQTETEGLTIVYATHIFDGLWLDPARAWPTHLWFLGFSKAMEYRAVGEVAELGGGAAGDAGAAGARGLSPVAGASYSPLLSLCERWIREDGPTRKV